VQDGNSVFREWAHAWARRVIVRNAIRMIEPWKRVGTAEDSMQQPEAHFDNNEVQEPSIAKVLRLNDFDRFVFILTTLERYRPHDCCDLLGCPVEAVCGAELRATERLQS